MSKFVYHGPTVDLVIDSRNVRLNDGDSITATGATADQFDAHPAFEKPAKKKAAVKPADTADPSEV